MMRSWFQNNKLIALVIGLLLIAFISSVSASWSMKSSSNEEWWSGFLQNFSTEVLGAIATFGLFELILGRQKESREKGEAEEKEKRQLIIEMRSTDNTTALNALAQIRENGWDKDGTLKGANLEGANLHGADLRDTNLHGADLKNANLQDAKLQDANLKSADLREANLQGAKLWNANLYGANLNYTNLQNANLTTAKLQGAGLHQANLQGANLVHVHLQGANLFQANLQGADLAIANLQGAKLFHANLQDANLFHACLQNAHLESVNFNEKTIMPDARPIGNNYSPIYDKYWTLETDMRRYTDPNHPDFWQGNWVNEERE